MRTNRIIEKIRASVAAGGKVLVCGNGGSAAMAEHFVGELVCDGIPAIALTDAPTITAIGNDHGFDYVFVTQVQTLGKKGDIFIGLTTSGRSENISLAQIAAVSKGMEIIWFPIGDDVQETQERHLHMLHEIWRGLL